MKSVIMDNLQDTMYKLSDYMSRFSEIVYDNAFIEEWWI